MTFTYLFHYRKCVWGNCVWNHLHIKRTWTLNYSIAMYTKYSENPTQKLGTFHHQISSETGVRWQALSGNVKQFGRDYGIAKSLSLKTFLKDSIQPTLDGICICKYIKKLIAFYIYEIWKCKSYKHSSRAFWFNKFALLHRDIFS